MKKELTKTDIGEIEFQIGFFTGKTAEILMNNRGSIDILIIEKSDTMFSNFKTLLYVVRLFIEDNEVRTHNIIAINGKDDIDSELDIISQINRGLLVFNIWW